MAKVKPIELCSSMWGKICMHSEYSFVRGRKSQYTMKICNPSTQAPTAAQLKARALFKTTTLAIKTILADTEQKATAEAGFKAQKKYSNLYDYLFAQEYAKAKANYTES